MSRVVTGLVPTVQQLGGPPPGSGRGVPLAHGKGSASCRDGVRVSSLGWAPSRRPPGSRSAARHRGATSSSLCEDPGRRRGSACPFTRRLSDGSAIGRRPSPGGPDPSSRSAARHRAAGASCTPSPVPSVPRPALAAASPSAARHRAAAASCTPSPVPSVPRPALAAASPSAVFLKADRAAEWPSPRLVNRSAARHVGVATSARPTSRSAARQRPVVLSSAASPPSRSRSRSAARHRGAASSR